MKLEKNLKTSNKFDCLDEEECLITEVIKMKSNGKKIKKQY